MGNRAVITTEKDWKDNGIGIYVHWNGGYDSVNAFLAYCEAQGYRKPESDSYGYARLTQIIANFFGGQNCIGIGRLDELDCDNGDNGVYIIQDWRIVGRYYNDYADTDEYDLEEFMLDIDCSMREDDQLGAEKIHEYIQNRKEKEDEIPCPATLA